MTRKRTSSSVQDEIDRNLKRAYEDVAKQALPSRFTDLLNQLREQDASSKPSEKGSENEQ